MVASIINLVMWIAGLFGFGKPPDPNKDERASGEKLGVAETEAANAAGAVTELEHSAQGAQTEHAAVAADPDRLQRDDNPSIRVWRPGDAD